MSRARSPTLEQAGAGRASTVTAGGVHVQSPGGWEAGRQELRVQFPADSAPVSILGRQRQDSQLGSPHFPPPLLEQHRRQLPSPRPGREMSILTMGRITEHPIPGRNTVWGPESWVPPLGNRKSFAVSQQPGPRLLTHRCVRATSMARPVELTAQQRREPCPASASSKAEFSDSKEDPDPRLLLKLQILIQQAWGGA